MYNCECKVLKSTAVTTTGGDLVITLPNVSTIRNGEIIKFCITQSIDYTNPLGTVSVSINGTTFPILDKYGNSVRISQIRTRKVYVVAVGAQTPNMIMLTCIPCSTFSYPTYTAPAATSTSV